jgi:hypothetical protein
MVELTEGEHDLMGRVCQFAAARLSGEQSVYQATMYSKSLGTPVYLIIGFGEAALQLEKVITKATHTPDSLIERVGL